MKRNWYHLIVMKKYQVSCWESLFIHSLCCPILAVRENHLQFGDCAVKESRQITFTLTNHSTTNIYWFQWPTGSHLVIFPRTGHLHPGKSKDITVTFKASQPKCLKNVKAFAKLSQIIYSKPLSQVRSYTTYLMMYLCVRCQIGMTACAV